MTRVNDQELGGGGGELSISSFLGVGNRPPKRKKLEIPGVPGGMATDQIKPCITRGLSGERSIFSRWVARQFLYSQIEVVPPVVGAEFKKVN